MVGVEVVLALVAPSVRNVTAVCKQSSGGLHKWCASSAREFAPHALRTHDASMVVDRGNALVGARDEQLGADELLHRDDDAVLAPERDDRARVLYRLVRILDLRSA